MVATSSVGNIWSYNNLINTIRKKYNIEVSDSHRWCNSSSCLSVPLHFHPCSLITFQWWFLVNTTVVVPSLCLSGHPGFIRPWANDFLMNSKWFPHAKAIRAFGVKKMFLITKSSVSRRHDFLSTCTLSPSFFFFSLCIKHFISTALQH